MRSEALTEMNPFAARAHAGTPAFLTASGVVAVGVGYALPSTGPLLLLAAVGPLVALALLAIWARSQPWVVLLPLSAVIVLTPKTGATPLATLAGRAVLPVDVVLALAAVAAALGIGHLSNNLRGSRLAAVVLVLASAVSFGAGFGTFGTRAVLELRPLLALLTLTAYVLSLDAVNAVAAVRRWLYFTAGALVVLAAGRVITQGLGNANDLVLVDGQMVTTRPLVSSQAALVGAAALIAGYDWATGRGSRFGAAAACFAAVVVLTQHRSVWVATLAGGLLLLPRLAAARVVKATLVVLWASALLAPLLLLPAWGDTLTATLARSAATASLSSGTGGDRTASAALLVRRSLDAGLSDVLLGRPYGSGWERSVLGRVETYQPHNAYVQTFGRSGLVGLIAVLVVVGSALARRRRPPSAQVAVGWVALFAVYSTAYAFPFELAPLVAIAVMNGAALAAPEVGTPAARLTQREPLPVAGVVA